MRDSKLKQEYTRLLFAFYGKAQIMGFPFAILVFSIFYGKVNSTLLLAWLATIFALHGLQMWHAKQFFVKQDSPGFDYQRWSNTALLAFLVQGCAWASVMLFITGDLTFEFFLVTFLLTLSVLTFSASGYSRMLLVYAIPMLSVISIVGYFHFPEYRHIASLGVIGIGIFYMISRTFEKTLLESIKIRFEKQELVKALQRKNEEAEQANRAKSVFLASASHDLRQPMHALGLYLDALSAVLTTDEQRLLGKKMALSVASLAGLFDGILDISKLDSGIIKPKIESISIERIITQVRRSLEPSAEKKQLKISLLVTPLTVKSDPILLERILNNLLSNAIRYTNQGEITLRCNKVGDRVAVAVEDTGLGIPEEEKNRIFDEFYQLDNPERDRIKGLGLGLSIVQRLCKLMDHELHMNSTPGVGTTFTVTLPEGDLSESITALGGAALPLSLEHLKVIFIDDEQSIRDALAMVLRRWGCEVCTAGSLDEASSAIDSDFIPQLIISDYRLQDSVTGIEVIDTINGKLVDPVPAILVTGDTSPDLLARIAESGHEVLHKPVAPGLLRTAIVYSITTESTGSEPCAN